MANRYALWCFNGILSRKVFRSKVKQCWWEKPWVHFCGPTFNVRLPSTSDKATAGSFHAGPLFKLFLFFLLPPVLLLPHLFLLYPWRIYNVIHWNFKTDRGGGCSTGAGQDRLTLVNPVAANAGLRQKVLWNWRGKAHFWESRCRFLACQSRSAAVGETPERPRQLSGRSVTPFRPVWSEPCKRFMCPWPFGYSKLSVKLHVVKLYLESCGRLPLRPSIHIQKNQNEISSFTVNQIIKLFFFSLFRSHSMVPELLLSLSYCKKNL